MIDVILETLHDSIRVFIFIFIFYVLFSFVEVKVVQKLTKKNTASLIYGSLAGLIPQCGVSVVASDLYLKRHISVGTLIAIFLTCSDEALPLILSSGIGSIWIVILLIVIKFVVGFISGFMVDVLVTKKDVVEHLKTCDCCDIEVHTGCCNHHIDDEREDKFDIHVWHPFLHSLKLTAYVLIINFILGTIIHFVGESTLESFLEYNKYLSPLFSIIIGLIPNCASSVILAELYISKSISFGTILAGLLMNAGLGMVFLFKGKERLKNKLFILFTLIMISLVCGYITCLILGF